MRPRNALLILLVVLPHALNAQVTATAADTAYARAALTRALQSFSRIAQPMDETHVDQRFMRQLVQWDMPDEAWSLALRRDSMRSATDPAANAFDAAARFLGLLFTNGDTTGVRTRVERLPAHQRDVAIQWLVGYALCNDPAQAQHMLDRIQTRVWRARALMNQASSCLQNDTAAARARVREALDIVTADTTGSTAFEVRTWLFRLRQLGGAVTIDELVDAVQRESGDRQHARFSTVSMLVAQGERAAVLPLLDTLLTQYSAVTPRPYGLLASIHELRGDSTTARLLRDTGRALGMAGTQQPRRFEQSGANSRLWQAIGQSDWTRVQRELTASLGFGDSVGVLIASATHAQSRVSYPAPGQSPVPPSATHLAFADSLYGELWRVSASLPALLRDSVRVSAVGLLARIDVERALAAARGSFGIARLRERALAEVVRVMVNTDADRAAALAEPLRDAKARNIAFPPLAERAVAGGRLAAARRYADRTAGGVDAVQAQYAVVRALLAADSVPQARTHVATMLAHLDPVWRSESYVIVVAPGFYTALPPELPGMPRQLIGQVVSLALRAGATAQLTDWAGSRPSAEARSAAGLAIAEGMAQYRLGQRPDYPIH